MSNINPGWNIYEQYSHGEMDFKDEEDLLYSVSGRDKLVLWKLGWCTTANRTVAGGGGAMRSTLPARRAKTGNYGNSSITRSQLR